MRRIESCLNCAEPREIAAHGLCFRCYRQQERSVDSQAVGVDRHSGAIRKEHKKILRGFTAVMTGLSDLGVSRQDVVAVRSVIDPYLEPIAKFLSAPPAQEKTKAL